MASRLTFSTQPKLTLVDIRYLPADKLGEFVEFENQDVLFLYSTLVLNQSSMLK